MAGRKTYVDNACNRRLGRVGLAHGTAVARSSGSSLNTYNSSSSSVSSRSGSGTYVDNSYNRRLGRVGMEYGIAVVSRSSGGPSSDTSFSCSSSRTFPSSSGIFPSSSGTFPSSSGTYVDNSYNTSIGRSGSPSRDAASLSRSSNGTGSSGRGTYVDNSYNGGLGRVSMEYGTALVSTSNGGPSRDTSFSCSPSGASGSGSGTYVGNSYNRSLGRVGMELYSLPPDPYGEYGTAVVSGSSGGPSRDTSFSCSPSGTSGSGSGTYIDNSYNRSLGRVSMEYGTAVVSTSSGGPSSNTTFSCSPSGASGSDSGTYVDNSYNRSVGPVGMEYGTAVGFSGSGSGTFVDNSYNGSVGPVGMKYGTVVVSSGSPFRDTSTSVVSKSGSMASGTDPTSCSSKPIHASSCPREPAMYVDNAYNRRLGHVGKPKMSLVVSKHGIASSDGKDTYLLSSALERKLKMANAIDDCYDSLLNDFQLLDLNGATIPDDVEESSAARIVRLEDIEEDWKKKEILPQTDFSQIEEVATNRISMQDLEDFRLIGQGGFGIVYAALWKTTKTPVAYKRLAYQRFSQKKLQSFVREIELFSKLEHNNIVKMLGAVMEKDNIGIVMEYFKKTLFDALFNYEEDCLAPSDKLRIVGEIGSALEYLHTHEPPIAHRDIKSQNILLDCNATAKVCDFGLSVIKNTIQSSRSTRGKSDAPPGQGTPRYSAPEVLRGELLKLEDLLMTDIYSFSLVLYEVVLEEEPYEELSLQQLVKNVGYGELRATLEKVENTDLIVLLLQCWSKIPRERPTIKQLNKQWTKIILPW